MSKGIVFIGLIMVLLLSSCVLPGGKAAKTEEPTAEPVAEQPVQPAQPQEPAAPTQPEPAAVVAEPTAEVVEPTAEETPQAAGFDFRDEFDLSNDNFSEDVITTTQAVTRDQMQTLASAVQDGILEFKIRDNETYVYKFVNGSNAEDVVVEAKWKSNGQGLNGASLLCRASEDFTSWYEMRISSQGEWQLLRYDKSIRDNDPYKNPYVSIKKGQAKMKLVRVSGDNVSKLSCVGPKITYEVNGQKIVETSNNDIKGGGLVGIGVMSQSYLPVVIQWDYLSITAPK